MNIKFIPKDENHPKNQRAVTDVGSFLPGEISTVAPDQEWRANQLIANGEFEQTDEEPNGDELADQVSVDADESDEVDEGGVVRRIARKLRGKSKK